MNIVVDCPDAGISARFWAAVLGWERVQENADSVDIADASDGRRRLVFQHSPCRLPPARLAGPGAAAAASPGCAGRRPRDRRSAGARPGRGPARGTCRARGRNLPGLRRPGRTPVLSRAARNHLNRGAFILGRPRPPIRSPTRRAPFGVESPLSQCRARSLLIFEARRLRFGRGDRRAARKRWRADGGAQRTLIADRTTALANV